MLFIPPDLNLKEGDTAIESFVNLSKEQLVSRWYTDDGKTILNQWKDSGFTKEKLLNLVGQYYDHIDLRGINLSHNNLTELDLSNIDFFAADFSESNLSKSNLSNSWLSETIICGSKFDWATMDSVLIDKANFDNNTTFYGVNLFKINFTLATLLKDLAEDQQRILTLEETKPITAFLLKWSCDYGRSFSLFFFWTFSIIFGFSLIYLCSCSGISSINSYIDSLYFSVITFSTLGYGDILPTNSLGKIVVMLEVFFGYIMLGLLVGIISRRVIGR